MLIKIIFNKDNEFNVFLKLFMLVVFLLLNNRSSGKIYKSDAENKTINCILSRGITPHDL